MSLLSSPLEYSPRLVPRIMLRSFRCEVMILIVEGETVVTSLLWSVNSGVYTYRSLIEKQVSKTLIFVLFVSIESTRWWYDCSFFSIESKTNIDDGDFILVLVLCVSRRFEKPAIVCGNDSHVSCARMYKWYRTTLRIMAPTPPGAPPRTDIFNYKMIENTSSWSSMWLWMLIRTYKNT